MCFWRSRYTGKERDTESGNDYFGARYYASSMGRFMSPDWSAKVEPVPYAKLSDPQTLNLYSYVLNRPLSSVDPNGHNWFDINGKWQWHPGDSWKDGQGHKYSSPYTGLLVAQKYGVDQKTGANLYHITLYDQIKLAGVADGFSDGKGHPSVKDGNYMLNLDKRDPIGPDHLNPNSPLLNPDHYSGIQKIMHGDVPDPLGGPPRCLVCAYGFVRAYLNGSDGDYVHGQYPAHNWTHGCLSYGSNYDFGEALWNMPARPTPAAIDVPVVKP